MEVITKTDHAKRVHLAWIAANLEKVSLHSRKYYGRKREDPEFRKLLADRAKARRLKFKEAKALIVVPSIEIEKAEVVEKQPKKNGRPRKYP